jgi:hypothetical protein
VAERVVPETQAGFRPGRSTLDAIFVARLLVEKYREQRMDMSIAFVDLTKAFDTVDRSRGRSFGRSATPPTSVSLVRAFHDGMVRRSPSADSRRTRSRCTQE